MATLVRRSRAEWLPGLAGFASLAMLVRLANDMPSSNALAATAGDAIDVLVAIVVLRLALGSGSTLERPFGVVALFGAAFAGAFASAMVGSLAATPGEGIEPLADLSMRAGFMWFIGRALGEVVVVALIDAWRTSSSIRLTRARRIEAVALISLIVASNGVAGAVPRSGTLLAVALGTIRSIGWLWVPVRLGRRATATMLAILVYEYAALLVVGHVSVFGVRLVWTTSPDQLTLGIGITELMLSLLAIVGALLGLSALMCERQQTARRLQEDEAKFRAITESSLDAIIVTDAAGRISLANPAARALFGRDDLAGRAITSIVAPADGGDGPMPFPLGRRCECIGLRADASQFPIEASWWSYETSDGTLACTGILRDVSERKHAHDEMARAHAELERSNQDLAEFAYVASHDLQEPLRMVASFLRLLSDRYEGRLDADADQFIGYAMEGAERLNALVRDLLSYSRAGTTTLDLRPVDLGEAVKEALDLLRVTIRDTGARVRVDDLPHVEVHPSLFGQVLQNLLSNACKFHRDDSPPRVEITSRPGPAGPIFMIVDHGIGIPSKDRDQVFQPFRRLHGRERFPGTGIGLAVARKIVERHGGTIWFEETPGGGATACFTIGAGATRAWMRGVA